MELKLTYSEGSKSTGNYVADFPEAAKIELDVDPDPDPDLDPDNDNDADVLLDEGKAYGKFIIYG